ncbi:MAG TPA: hypothetical protein VFV52_16235 [Bacilli bacterium]|nr:hypothetical protein [Bacilli bacterium]
MTDRQWKDVEQELKRILPGTGDGPQDPQRFKERVLAEYERRNRQETRSRWTRRAMTAATVAAAVWVGLLVAGPLDDWLPANGDKEAASVNDSTATDSQQLKMAHDKLMGRENKEAANKGKTFSAYDSLAIDPQEQAAEQVASRYVDLILQKREEDAKQLLALDALSNATVIPPNKSNPHITGYTLTKTLENKLDGTEQLSFLVTITRADYHNHASMESYKLDMRMENDRWVIGKVAQLNEEQSYYQDSHGNLFYQSGGREHVALASGKVGRGEISFLSINPHNVGEYAYILQGNDHPDLYVVRDGRAQRLNRLPQGEIGEIIWEGDFLLVNYSSLPVASGGSNNTEVLFFDPYTGQSLNMHWLTDRMSELGLHHFNAVQALPGGRVRLRADALSLVADFNQQRLHVDAGNPQQISQVKYDHKQALRWPTQNIQILTPDQLPKEFANLQIPQDRQVNQTKEVGFYIVNGSLQAFSYGEQELQVEVSREPGRVQAVALPYSMFSRQAGQRFKLTFYDESGYILSSYNKLAVPAK